MSDQLKLQFGPWTPDLKDVAVDVTSQLMKVPLADCNNVYYADGTYKSLPTPSPLSGFSVGETPIGAFTAIDASGNPVQLVGTKSVLLGLNNTGVWAVFSTGFNATRWQFAQFGQSVYAVDDSATLSVADGLLVLNIDDINFSNAGLLTMTGSITSNLLTVSSIAGTPLLVGMTLSAAGITLNTTILSLGTGVGGNGTYNLSTTPNLASQTIYANIPPVGNVLAASGQFLIQGDIGFQYSNGTFGNNAYVLGTGNGSTKTFTGTIPNVPIVSKSVFPSLGNVSTVTLGTDNGFGVFGNPTYIGTVNYGTGAISLTFNSAPGNGVQIIVTYTQGFPERVQWSAIAQPSFWPLPLTNAALAFQSGYQDLQGDLGPVMAVVGYPLYFLIFQRSGITRATYQGGNVVFAFAPYEFKRGLIARNAYVQVGPIVYFLSDQGFFATDGANVFPIGTAQDNSAGIDSWFWSNVNKNALASISAGYDAQTRSILFGIPTTSALPDIALIYNLLAQRWTKAAMPATVLWSDTNGTRHNVGVISRTGSYGFSNYPYAYETLIGPPLAGYVETVDLTFIDGQRRLTTSASPQINCTDQPLVIIGNRDGPNDPIVYANGNFPDRFSKQVPCLSSGKYTRVRLQSAAATAMSGIALEMETEGPI